MIVLNERKLSEIRLENAKDDRTALELIELITAVQIQQDMQMAELMELIAMGGLNV